MRTVCALLMTVGLLGPSTPTLSIEEAKLTVTFDKGAVFACTQYENQNVIGRDGKLETAHDCGFIDETITTFSESLIWSTYKLAKGDYRIFVEIGYPRKGNPSQNENEGTTYVDYVVSNAIKVVN